MGYNIYITAGGTGGHLFPALSLAQKLISQGHHVTFVTDPQGASIAVDTKGIVIKTLGLSRFSGGLRKKIRFVYDLIKCIITSWRLIWRQPVDVIIGFGGYPSFPLVLAGMIQGRPLVLHEQNAYLGRVNRFAARSAQKIATSSKKMNGLHEKDESKVVLTGNVVRPQVTALYDKPYVPAAPETDFRLFIIGGSQGARVFSTLVPEAVKLLPRSFRDRLVVVQQSRPELLEKTRQNYLSLNVRATVEVFFHAIEDELAAAHLVIARSGASTVSELMLSGRPPILVPFPYAADDHQYYNALEVERAKAGWCCREESLSADLLASHIEMCMTKPDILIEAAHQLKMLAEPNALENLVTLVEKQLRDAT